MDRATTQLHLVRALLHRDPLLLQECDDRVVAGHYEATLDRCLLKPITDEGALGAAPGEQSRCGHE